MLNVKQPLLVDASGHDNDATPFVIGIQCCRSNYNKDDDAVEAAKVDSHDGKCSSPTKNKIVQQAMIPKSVPNSHMWYMFYALST